MINYFWGYDGRIVELLKSTISCPSLFPSTQKDKTIATPHTPQYRWCAVAPRHTHIFGRKLGIEKFQHDQKLVPQEPMHGVETARRG
jgi:hypothetical protein